MTINGRSVYFLIFIICMNCICTVYNYMGVNGAIVTPGTNSTHLSEISNITDIAQTYDYSQPYSDFPFGVINFLSLLGSLVVWGYPSMLLSFGLPSTLVTALVAPYLVMWMLVVILNWIGGRDV
jgi:hypothetical protein